MFAKINDLVLGPDSGATWSLTDGVAPYVMSVEVEKLAADAMVASSVLDQATVTITDDQSVTIKAEKLTVIGAAPTSSPYTEILTVSDRRWIWPRVWIKRSYNVRRKTGRTRKLPDDQANLANLQADVGYHQWSLRAGSKGAVKPWTAKEVLEDVLKCLVGSDYKLELGGAELPVVEGLELDSPGDVALGRVLSYLGGLIGVTVELDGTVRAYDRFSGKEGALLGLDDPGDTKERGSTPTSLPMVHGYPVFAVQDRRVERPRSVKVLFTKAVELRFDSDEKSTPQPGGTAERGAAELKAQNVLPLPEDATINGAALPFGSWVRLDDYLSYLGTLTPPSGLPAITLDIINRAWLHSALEVYGLLDPSGLWARRVAAIRSHYRRTYRVARPYSERVREFWARRVKLQDVESNGFLASPAFFDYAAYTTWRGVNANKAADGPDPAKMVRNVYSSGNSANGIIGTPISSLKKAPANVGMVDPELGIFSIDFYPDVSARAINYVHSALVDVPTDDPQASDTWLQDGHLYQSRELSCLLSTTPQAPNDNRQLYEVELTEDDPGVLSLGEGANNQKGIGPSVYVRVDPNEAMARFAWDDSRAPLIRQWFAESTDPSSEIVESGESVFGLPLNADELMAVAKTHATAIYTQYVDHAEGGLTTGLRDLKLTGIAKEIRHEAGADGALTTVSMPPAPPQLDLSQLLPPSVRRLVDRSGEA